MSNLRTIEECKFLEYYRHRPAIAHDMVGGETHVERGSGKLNNKHSKEGPVFKVERGFYFLSKDII
jgi:hypothetical protein